ncbi:Mitogen-activated protein kinase, partial [Caligus rogercresseyi]
MSEIEAHLCKRYEVHKRLGKGAYGIVWKAKSKRSGRNGRPADLSRIIFLKEFNNHPNVIRLLNVHKAENDRDLYLVFEYMSTDLHHVIRKGNILRDIHKEYIMYQLFRPRAICIRGTNILLDSECRCKIADFGLARSLSSSVLEENQECLTDYVATRWYRAPEILLGSQKYTKGVDMWSLGCILGEMIIGKPLFREVHHGSDRTHCPSLRERSTTQAQTHLLNTHGSARGEMISRHSSPKWSSSIKEKYPEGIDLLQKLLQVIPEDRITANEALKHKYHDLSLSHDVVPPFNDNVQLSVDQYRRKLYDIIKSDKMNG